MKHLSLQDIRTISLPTSTVLRLEYYLVETCVYCSFVYGIRIHSHLLRHTKDTNIIYEEEVHNLSYSKQEVCDLLTLCSQYQVTPTDLISALDILMNLS